MHNSYHTTGKTDLQAFRDAAERRLTKGEETTVHLHSYSEMCRPLDLSAHINYVKGNNEN